MTPFHSINNEVCPCLLSGHPLPHPCCFLAGQQGKFLLSSSWSSLPSSEWSAINHPEGRGGYQTSLPSIFGGLFCCREIPGVKGVWMKKGFYGKSSHLCFYGREQFTNLKYKTSSLKFNNLFNLTTGGFCFFCFLILDNV